MSNRLITCLMWMLMSAPLTMNAQQAAKKFTRADTLRGSITPERSWWDVTHYAIDVEPDYEQKFIKGRVDITFRVLSGQRVMQIDLQEPMAITDIEWESKRLSIRRDGNTWQATFPETPLEGSLQRVRISFSGHPRVAQRPPWDGGWIFTKDLKGRPWMSVACQGLGASVWYPCKDHQSDEPDSASIRIQVPDTLFAVANGRLRSVTGSNPGKKAYTWAVANPINIYNIIPYIGKYKDWSETFAGESGQLDCSYYALDYDLERARTQFKQVPSMLTCFEHWFGPYPFYEDGYKLVQSPHLGMEHQSAVAYGNDFKNGYRGNDLSQSGWGLKWDFIIIHESGHEWFGNNISSKDLADMWVHESFTNYSETIYTGCQFGQKAGREYVAGTRRLIRNDIPIVGIYGVNDEGSGDMYYKGGNMIHYMRQLFRDDEKFRRAMRAMNDTFRHKTVGYEDIVGFWSRKAGMDLAPLFRQYLQTTKVPKLAYRIEGRRLLHRWVNCEDGYNIPVRVLLDGKEPFWINPRSGQQRTRLPRQVKDILPDPDFYITLTRE